MEKSYSFKPSNVCSREYDFTIEDGIIKSFKVIGGCQGNLSGISSLIIGCKVEDVIKRLSGIKCHGSRTGETSCPDQISIALKESLK